MGELWPRRAGFPHPGENQAEKPVFPSPPQGRPPSFPPPSFSPQATHGFHPAGKASQSSPPGFSPQAASQSFAARRRRKKVKWVFPGDTPQGGFSCPCGAIHLLRLGKNTSHPRRADFSRRESRSALGALSIPLAKMRCIFAKAKKGRAENSARPLQVFIRSRRAAERSDGPA